MVRREVGAAAAAAVMVLVLGLSGCGGGDTVVATDDGTVTVDKDADRMEITTDDGTAVITGDGTGELPDGWPDAVELPEGGAITGSLSLTGQGTDGWNVSLTYEDMTPKDLAAAFDSLLEGAGFTSQGTFSSDEGTASSYSSDGYVVSVAIAPDESGSTAIVTVAVTG